MSYEETKQRASEALGDMSLAIARKNRLYNNYIKHGAVNAAIDVAADIEIMEAELPTKGEAEQMSLFGQDTWSGKMSPEPSVPARPTARTSASFLRKSAALQHADFLYLDLRAGGGNLLGQYWEKNSPSLGEWSTLNSGMSHSSARESSLSRILEAIVQAKYYLSKTASWAFYAARRSVARRSRRYWKRR